MGNLKRMSYYREVNFKYKIRIIFKKYKLNKEKHISYIHSCSDNTFMDKLFDKYFRKKRYYLHKLNIASLYFYKLSKVKRNCCIFLSAHFRWFLLDNFNNNYCSNKKVYQYKRYNLSLIDCNICMELNIMYTIYFN